MGHSIRWAGLGLAILLVVGIMLAINSTRTTSLRIFIWEEYIDPEVFRLFEREFDEVVQGATACTPEFFGRRALSRG